MPENPPAPKLGDLVDFGAIQQMLEAHYHAAGMPSGIVDATDGTVLAGTGWQDICLHFHRVNPISAARCRQSNLAISRHVTDGRPFGYKCPNGMWDIGIPIMVDGAHLATFFLGQFTYEGEDSDRAFFERQADELGFNKQEYLEALAKVPVFSHERVNYILAYNTAMASFIGKLAASNLKVQQQLCAAQQDKKDLADQKAFMQGLVESLPIPLFIKDATLTYTGCNAAFEQLVDQPREQIIGRKAEDFTEKTFACVYERMDRTLLQDGQKQSYSSKFTSRNGYVYDLEFHKGVLRDASGQPTGIVGVAFDITERLKTERELEKSRHLIKNILESAPSAIIGVDENGLVNHWNICAQNLFGKTPQSVLGQGLQQVLPIMAPHMDKLMNALRNREVGMVERMQLVREKEVHLMDVQFYPLVANGITGVVIRADDVTERERLRELMIQTEKMMSVGGLAAGMAHEINNPLGAILQTAQLVQSRLSPDREANRRAAAKVGSDMDAVHRYLEDRDVYSFLENIRQSGLRASRIVANMINFSRKSDTSKEPVHLAELLDKSLELAENDYDLKKQYDFRHIKIIKEYDPALPPITCSRTEIEQVVLNLLKNSAQAMYGQEMNGDGPTITLRLHGKDGRAVVEVQDNGPGIEPGMRQKVFEPFFTTKGPGEGTGLGLSVSYFIVVNNHGGTIRALEPDGRGALVVIELPMDAA